MPAQVIKFGEPENESERSAILYLSRHLSDNYRLYTNLEIASNERFYEVDIILLAPHAVYIIDVKGVYGRVEVDSNFWKPTDRQSYPSPLKKYRQHARVLKGSIVDADLFRKRQLQKIYVQATVLLTAEDVEIVDVSHNNSERKNIVQLGKECLEYFKDWQSIDTERYNPQITDYFHIIDRVIRGRSKPISRVKYFGSWEVIEKLGEEKDRYTEYSAKKVTVGLSDRMVRLKVYSIDPWLNAEERAQEYRLLNTAFQAVYELPKHDNILEVKDIFESQDAAGLVLVIENIKGQSLRQLIRNKELTLEQKLDLMGDVLRALDHAHKHGVIHRNVIPENIFVTPEKQAKLTGFDYARIESRTGTIADVVKDELEDYSIYQDADCRNNPSQACEQSDLFSAGQVFYELLLGKTAFTSFEQMEEKSGVFPVLPSHQYSDLPKGFDAWLQKLCAFNRSDRYQTAREALDRLTPLSKVTPELTNLPADIILNGQYQIVKRLGKPGSFAVAYKVREVFSEDFQVIKIVVRDSYSLFERVQQEFRALDNVLKNPHPHIVTARCAGFLHEYDNTPFLVFEYVEGQDLEERFSLGDLPLEESITIIRQTAEGLAHLHTCSIYHQDIKPSNLLITSQGVKIIDFNVAVTAADESIITAGTRRYLPPDFKSSVAVSPAERIDRDLYALGITAYECIVGHYPFNAAQPIVGQECSDIRQFEGCEDLSEALVQFLRRAIAPKRADRFSSATAFLEALNSIPSFRQLPAEVVATEPEAPPITVEPPAEPADDQSDRPLQETELENGLQPPEPPQPLPEPTSISPISQPAPVEPVEISPPIVPQAFPTPAFHLFELPSRNQQAAPNPDQPIVLDPSKAYYPIPEGYIAIETEVDWMRYFGTSATPYWVRGEALCNWAEEWLRCWNRTHLIAEVKQPPKEKLATLLKPLEVPCNWTQPQCLAVVTHLERYPSVAHLLADLTDSDLDIWLSAPSVENLAQWLTVEVPEEARILEQVWQRQRPSSALTHHYQTTDKRHFLKQWLGLADPKPADLTPYPLDVPPSLRAEFETFWKQKLYSTQGEVLDALNFQNQPSVAKRIATIACEVLTQHPEYITRAREKQLKGYLNRDRYQQLIQHQRPPVPDPLPPDALLSEVLCWATEAYLPLRRWETTHPCEKPACDRLAASFEDWIFQHYPSLIVDSVESSWLNYNVNHHIQDLCKKGSVFWIVVDGLGWLDHQELIARLTETSQLQLEQPLQPRFSILPTKTEYAKWSLYSQQRPGHSSWEPDAGKGFTATNGKRYTDNDVKYQRLQKDLKLGKLRLYCWDTDRLDKLFHDKVDWQELYTVQRPRELKAIAEDILRFADMHPQKEELRIVIASDHGQLMGISAKLTHTPKDLKAKGRMAIGRADHPQFFVLDKARFDLPHDISVIRGSHSFSSFHYNEDKSSVGCHGGLYPEEVVVGFSVLARSVKRNPVIVKCSGAGRSGEASRIEVEVYNPNALAITDLKLTVAQLAPLQQGQELSGIVAPNQSHRFSVSVPNLPELPPNHEGKKLSLTGKLEFQYQGAELSSADLDKTSAIEVEQIFSSGIEGLDDFL